jgi:hypothetical protein
VRDNQGGRAENGGAKSGALTDTPKPLDPPPALRRDGPVLRGGKAVTSTHHGRRWGAWARRVEQGHAHRPWGVNCNCSTGHSQKL